MAGRISAEPSNSESFRNLRPDWSRRVRGFGFSQVAINRRSCLATFGNRPHDQRLSTTHVPGGEDTGHGGHAVVVGCDVSTRVEDEAQLLDHPATHRTDEAHRDQYQVGIQSELGASDRSERWW